MLERHAEKVKSNDKRNYCNMAIVYTIRCTAQNSSMSRGEMVSGGGGGGTGGRNSCQVHKVVNA